MRKLVIVLPLLLAALFTAAGSMSPFAPARAATSTLITTQDLGEIVGAGCYAHYLEGTSWPQVVGNMEGVVTCSQNFYYFRAVRPAPTQAPVRQLGRVVGIGCYAHHSEGSSWPQLVGGLEGTVTCSADNYYFWPVRYNPPLKNPTLSRSTLLCYYGNRAASIMGILGAHPLDELERRLRQLSAVYDRLNGDLGVTSCFDYVYMVADPDGHPYTHRTPRMDLFEEAFQFAAERGMLFFVDLQLGYRDIGEAVGEVLPLLRSPNVHLALDTEFYMARTGGVPGDTLGSMDAADVNRAVQIVQDFVVENGLPDKLVKVYQFDSRMLTNKELLNISAPNVTVLINADGVGFTGVEGKVGDYEQYARESNNALGIKLFLQWDSPLLQPVDVMSLNPQPHEIVYQ